MFLFFLRKGFLPNFKKTFLRFPFAVLSLFACTIFSFLEINRFDIEIDYRWVLFSVVGIAAYTISQLISEAHAFKLKRKVVVTLGLTLFLIFFCLTTNITGGIIFLFAALLLVPVAPYFLQDIEEKHYCNFNAKYISNIFFALLATLILCLGVSAILLSIHYLFEVRVPNKIYENIWFLPFVFFVPIYVLSNLPNNFQNSNLTYPKGIIFIFSYIICPFLIGYLGVLYSYFFKIISEWNLPKGSVAYMVIALGFLGVLTQISVYPFLEKSSRLLKIFYRYFHLSLLLPIIFLFIAAIVRIREYGVTENRYLVVIFAVWLAFVFIYSLVKREVKFTNIIFVLGAMMIFSSFGIWGAKNISGISQVARLKLLREKHDILREGKIQKESAIISIKGRDDVHSILRYLVKSDNLDPIKKWFPKDSYINLHNTNKLNAHTILKDMGVVTQNHNYNNFYLYSNKKIGNDNILLNIEGFSYYADLGSLFRGAKARKFISENDQSLQIALLDEGILEVTNQEHQSSLKFDIYHLLKKLRKDGVKQGTLPEAKRDSFILTQEEKDFKAKLYIKTIRATIENNNPTITELNATIAINPPTP